MDRLQERKYLYSTALKDSMHNTTWPTVAPYGTVTPPGVANHLSSAPEQFKLVCYYSLPTGMQDLQPEKIPPLLCTHVNVGFAGVENGTININSSDEEVSLI